MIDFHNHTIPNLDDGPKSLEESLSMYREAEKQGITDVINTVHYQHPKMEGKDTSYNHIIFKVDEMNKILVENNINVKIHPASEVFYLPNLVEILNNKITTFGKGRYMLVEFQTMSLPPNYKEHFFQLILKGITPIIAHPERYREIQNDISILKEWVDLGYIIQLDCGSILGLFGEPAKNTSHKIIQKNLCHLIGSDAHNNKKRNFCLSETLIFLETMLDKDSINIIIENAYNILHGLDCKKYSNSVKNNFLNKIFSIRKL